MNNNLDKYFHEYVIYYCNNMAMNMKFKKLTQMEIAKANKKIIYSCILRLSAPKKDRKMEAHRKNIIL
jgi:hypothetical protein